MKLKAWWTRFKKMQLASLRMLAVAIIIALSVGCEPTLRSIPGEAMSTQALQLVGNWEKFTSSMCSQIYPDTIHFQEGRLYFGQKDPPGTFTQWDVGTYEVIGHKQINISTANDAIITYEFSISDDILTFIDLEGCEFNYRRT